MLDMDDPQAYLHVVDLILASCPPNYKAVRIPLPSTYDWEYLEEQIIDYYDNKILDYIKFGFPLGISQRSNIISNANDNHASAKAYLDEVSSFIKEELSYNALLGPFDYQPHPSFTWSPLMTRYKGAGRRIILGLSYGEASVNKATDKHVFDEIVFSLKLPSPDALLPTLNRWGPHAHIFKLDISCTFRNVRVDPRDAIHLGIRWQDKYYIDKNLAFRDVHGTAIFESITDLIRFIMSKQEVQVFNYIDDIYVCCHKDVAHTAFEALNCMVEKVGLPINPAKVFPPATRLSIMGIVVDIDTCTFSIPEEKLGEMSRLCHEMFLGDRLSKRELQTLLGKLLYIHIYLNCLLTLLRRNHDKNNIVPDEGFYLDLLWFLSFFRSFNGIVTFRKSAVAETAFGDATLTRVVGIWGKRAYSAQIPSQIACSNSISQLELYNVVVATRLWAPHWRDKTVCIRCDNESAVSVCNSGKTGDIFMNLCLRNLWLTTSEYNIDLRVVHIRGKDNDLVDVSSFYDFSSNTRLGLS